MIAQALDAQLIDGGEVVEPLDSFLNSKEGLVALIQRFCECYVQASRTAAAIFGGVHNFDGRWHFGTMATQISRFQNTSIESP